MTFSSGNYSNEVEFSFTSLRKFAYFQIYGESVMTGKGGSVCKVTHRAQVHEILGFIILFTFLLLFLFF